MSTKVMTHNHLTTLLSLAKTTTPRASYPTLVIKNLERQMMKEDQYWRRLSMVTIIVIKATIMVMAVIVNNMMVQGIKSIQLSTMMLSKKNNWNKRRRPPKPRHLEKPIRVRIYDLRRSMSAEGRKHLKTPSQILLRMMMILKMIIRRLVIFHTWIQKEI